MFGFQDFLPIFQIALTLNFAVLAYFKYSSENSKDFFVSKKIENMMENMTFIQPYVTDIEQNHKNVIQNISDIYLKIKKNIDIAFSTVECTAIGMFFYSFFMLFYIATFKIRTDKTNISSFLDVEPIDICSYLLIPIGIALIILIATAIKRIFLFNHSKIIHIGILTFLLFSILLISMFWYNEITAIYKHEFMQYFIHMKIIVILCIIIFPFLPITVGLLFLLYIYFIGERAIVKKHGEEWESTLNPIVEQYKDRNKNNTDQVTALVNEVTSTAS